jgi:O-antigen ligase
LTQSSAKHVHLTGWLFLIGLSCASLVVSPFVLDFTLTARLVTFSLFLLLSLVFVKGKEIFKVDIILLSAFSYTFFCALSYIWALNKSEAIFEICRTTLAFFAFTFAAYIFQKNKDHFLNYFLKFCILLVFIGFGFAVYQALELKNFDKESIYIVTGINGHKNLYSSFLFLNLCFVILAFLKHKGSWKILSVVAIILTLTMLVFLRTKAVWIGSIVTVLTSLILFGFLNFKRLPKLNGYLLVIIIMIACNIAFMVFLKPIVSKGIDYNKTVSGKQELDKERLILWDKTIDMFRKHKVTGVGAGNWQIYFPDETLKGLWRAEDLNFTFQRPHNDPLWILSETGLIGFNLFLFFIVSLLVFAARSLRRVSDKKEIREIIPAISFIVGFLVISFFDFPKERIEHLAWSSVMMAFVYVYARQNSDLHKLFQIRTSSTTSFAGILIMAGILATGILRHKGETFTRKMYDASYSKDYINAVRYAEQAESFAYSIDPTSVPLDWYSGNAYAGMQNYNGSYSELSKAYKLAPYNRNVLNDLASACAMQGNIAGAKKYYEEAIRISPRFDDAKLNLAALYIQEKNYQKASECLKTLLHDSERRTNYQKLVDAFLPK